MKANNPGLDCKSNPAWERCGLTDKLIENVLGASAKAIPEWKELIGVSFLSDNMKEKYEGLLDKRLKILNFR